MNSDTSTTSYAFSTSVHAAERVDNWQSDVGSYLVVGTDELITSDSFGGGYVNHANGDVAGELPPLLARQGDVRIDPLALAFWLADPNHYGCHPIMRRTPFRKVSFLPASSSMRFLEPDGSVSVSPRRTDGSSALPQLDELLDATAEAISATSQSATVMFSGGKDSAAVYLALCSALGRENVQPRYVVTDSYSSGGSIDQALAIGELINAPVEVIDPGTWTEGEIDEWVDHSVSSMEQRFVAPLAPFRFLREETESLWSGDNMDSMLSFAAPKPYQFGAPPHAELLRGLKSVPFTGTGLRRPGLSRASYKFARILIWAAHKTSSASDVDQFQRTWPTGVRLLTEVSLGLSPYAPHSTQEQVLQQIDAWILSQLDSLTESGEPPPSRERTLFRTLHPSMYLHYHGSPNRFGSTLQHLVMQPTFMPLWRRDLSLKSLRSPKAGIIKYIEERSDTRWPTFQGGVGHSGYGVGGLGRPVRVLSQALAGELQVAFDCLPDMSPTGSRDYVRHEVDAAYELLAAVGGGKLAVRHDDRSFSRSVRLANLHLLASGRALS